MIVNLSALCKHVQSNTTTSQCTIILNNSAGDFSRFVKEDLHSCIPGMPAAEQTATQLQKWMAQVTTTVSLLRTHGKQENREVLTLIAGLSLSLSLPLPLSLPLSPLFL